LSHSFLTSPPPPHIYTLSLHDALPICQWRLRPRILFRSQEGLHAPPFNPPWFFGSFTFVPCSFFRDSWTLGHASAGACSREGRRSEEHTSELQSRRDLVCRLLLEKKKK